MPNFNVSIGFNLPVYDEFIPEGWKNNFEILLIDRKFLLKIYFELLVLHQLDGKNNYRMIFTKVLYNIYKYR